MSGVMKHIRFVSNCSLLLAVFLLLAVGCGEEKSSEKKSPAVSKKIVRSKKSKPVQQKIVPKPTGQPIAKKATESPAIAGEKTESHAGMVVKTAPSDIQPKEKPPSDKATDKKILKSQADPAVQTSEVVISDTSEAKPLPLPRKTPDIESSLPDKPLVLKKEAASSGSDEVTPIEPKRKDEPERKEIKPSAALIASGQPDQKKSSDSILMEGGENVLISSVIGLARKKEIAGIIEEYNPLGKLNPFAPLVEEPKKEMEKRKKKVVKKRTRPATPLQKVDLSQLKLVAVIRAESGNRAMVEESSGKGYIITKGTYIGTNMGKVDKILKNKIVVVEEEYDWKGNMTKREREMKIQRPPGEE